MCVCDNSAIDLRFPAGSKVRRLYESSGSRLETPGSLLSDGNDDPITVANLRMLLSREARTARRTDHTHPTTAGATRP